MNIQKRPIISIIIPVYNMEEYLEQTIGSLVNQTFRNIEILCIDDASTDRSMQILEAFKERDERVKLYSFSENKSAWSARMLGIREAKGKFIMFMDADDCLVPRACHELLREMKRDPVDILHFNTEVINVNCLPEEWVGDVERFIKPFRGRLEGKSILTTCFQEKKYKFTLWNKMFRANVCKKAFEGMDDAWLPRGQDKLTYFLIAYYAKSYRGVSGKAYYQYYYGRGAGGNTIVNLKQFERFCTMGLVADKLHDFLESKNAVEEYAAIDKDFRRELLNDCGAIWINGVTDKDKSAGYDLMLKYWRVAEVVSYISAHYDKQRYDVAKKLKEASSLQYDGRRIKTIATYYHSMEDGGVARAMSSLLKLWTEMGYRVVLITDSPASEKDYDIPQSVSRFVVPDFYHISGENYGDRAAALEKIIADNQIDLVVYHAWVSHLILWDELVIKSSGTAFITHCHSVFSYALLKPWLRYQDIIAPYLLSDGVIALSDMDNAFWSHFNNNVHTVFNPFAEDSNDWLPSDCSNHDILWVGRLSDEKRPYDALEIIKIVGQNVPDAKLHILGESKIEGYEDAYRKKIEELGIKDKVILHGFHKDVRPFYEKASVLLMTSRYEGFPLTLQEGMLAGLPIVMYELPYLTMVKNNQGITSVSQGDVVGASQEIIQLFKDDEKRLLQANQSRAFIDEMKKYDFADAWSIIFRSIGSKPNRSIPECEKRMMELMVVHLDEGYQDLREIRPIMNRKMMRTATLAVRSKDYLCDNGIRNTAKKVVEIISQRLAAK